MNNKTSEVSFLNYIKGVSIVAIILYYLIYNFLNVPSFIKMGSSFGGAGVHIFFIREELQEEIYWKQQYLE